MVQQLITGSNMKLNVNELKVVLKKGTLNYLIESIGLVISKDHVKCNMISKDRNVLLFLDMPNNLIEGLKDEMTMNFIEPNNKVKPYLDVIDDESVDIKVSDEKLVINKQLKLNFDDESVIDIFGKDNPINKIDFFHTAIIDSDFLMNFNKIQKIGRNFGKVYFSVVKNKMYIETTDKTNKFSNSLKFYLCDVKHKDFTLCFKFKSLVNLMSLIDGDFEIKYSYVEKNDLGLICFVKNDDTEKYFLMSVLDEG